jgi:hypothetical protein
VLFEISGDYGNFTDEPKRRTYSRGPLQAGSQAGRSQRLVRALSCTIHW